MLMMLLCACRTRLTNNTEVTSTIADEDGYLSSEYQMRRDMIGEPVAERPIFTGWGSDDSNEDYYDPGTDAFDNYDQGTLDEWDEPEDVTSSPSSSSGSSSSGGSSSSSSGGSSRNSSGSKDKEEEPEVEMVKLTYDLKEGGGIMNTIDVEKGSPFSKYLPDAPAAPKGYSFNGWHTKANEDSPVDPDATITEDCTIYAHWKADPKPEYTVTWKYDTANVTVPDADKLPKVIKNGDKFPDPMPVAHKKNYKFLGWYSSSGPVVAGQPCTADTDLEAKFSEQSWDIIYNNAKPAEENYQYYVSDSDDLVRGNPWDEATSPPDKVPFVIIKLTDDTYSAEAAKKAAEDMRKTNEKYANSKIIVIPKSATDSDSNKLYYQLILHKEMYGGLDGIESAAADTEATISDYAVDPDKAAPAQ